jgi:hypothetical protein
LLETGIVNLQKLALRRVVHDYEALFRDKTRDNHVVERKA